MKIDNKFTFKNYKNLKTRDNLNNKFLIIANNNTIFKKKFQKTILNKQKLTNKPFFLTIQKSLFKKFITFINGSIFIYFFCKKKFISIKKTTLNKKELMRMNILIFKLNNKIYSSKKLNSSNFLTYQENIITLFQLKNLGLKIILK